MRKTVVFFGSNTEVPKPHILQNGFYKDFGYGFYCTKYENQAKRWALTRKGKSIVNRYIFTEDPLLKIKSFTEMSDEWLDFVAECRNGTLHNYDIVEGPMADDQIWIYVNDYLEGRISREAFWKIVKFNHPTHQIVFCTEEALRTLAFKGSEAL